MQGTWHPQWPLRTVSSWTQSSSHIHIEFRKKQKFKVLYPFFNFEILSRFLPEYQTWNIHTIVSEPPTHWIFMLNITKAEITKPYVGFFFLSAIDFSFCGLLDTHLRLIKCLLVFMILFEAKACSIAQAVIPCRSLPRIPTISLLHTLVMRNS